MDYGRLSSKYLPLRAFHDLADADAPLAESQLRVVAQPLTHLLLGGHSRAMVAGAEPTADLGIRRRRVPSRQKDRDHARMTDRPGAALTLQRAGFQPQCRPHRLVYIL